MKSFHLQYRDILMLRNSVFKILNRLTLNDEPSPEYKQISDLNHSVSLIKEMDSAQNTGEINDAVNRLKHWSDSRQKQNDSLPLDALNKKRQVLVEASSKLSIRYYLMIICVLANAATMSAAMYSVFMSDLSRTKKCLAMGVSLVGMVEGSIHLYKAKRFFMQKYQLARIELECVDNAIKSKIPQRK